MDPTVGDLERLRLQLVDNVAKLQSLVKHWRVQEAEYEILKDGLAGLQENASEQEIREVTQDCVGDLLTQKEINTLIRDKISVRRPSQMINLIDRRIDYVQQNVKTTEKQLEREEQQLDEANYVGLRDEDGLPLTEITEELDDDDRVVSAKVIRPGDAGSKLLDVLRQGGLDDLGEESDQVVLVKEQNDKGFDAQNTTKSSDITVNSTNHAEPVPSATDMALQRKKSVTFADNLQVHEISEHQVSTERKVKFAEAVDISQATPINDPIIPVDESEDESALRREMLEYNMRKIGTIVAEIDLDEGGENDTDYDSEDEEYVEDDDEDEEDEFGRATGPAISDAYRTKMLALEKKLNAKAIINVGPAAKGVGNGREIESALKTTGNAESDHAKRPREGQTRGVRFADKLDIQDGPEQTPTSRGQTKTNEVVERPLKDQIIERESVTDYGPKPTNKKISRFKSSRGSANGSPSLQYDAEGDFSEFAKTSAVVSGDTRLSSLPSDPPKSTLHQNDPAYSTSVGEHLPTIVSTVIERPMTEAAAQEPDSLDPEIHAAEIRNTYHDVRNKLIQRENGFMDQNMEQHEDEYGGSQMSRFKAARLARQRLDRLS